MYKLQNFLLLREDEEAFSIFYNKYVREVVGKKKFDKLIKNIQLGEEISTPTDDAFALIVLENNEDIWLDILEKNDGKIISTKRGETKPENHRSDLKPKYTYGSGFSRNWTDEGIIRFNELRRMIIRDRKNNKCFIEKYIQRKREEMLENEPVKKKYRNNYEMVEAGNDLGYDENDCIENHSKEHKNPSEGGEELEEDSSSTDNESFDK